MFKSWPANSLITPPFSNLSISKRKIDLKTKFTIVDAGNSLQNFL